jgi:YD repeat-containing protein
MTYARHEDMRVIREYVSDESFLYDEMGNVTERQDNSSLALTEDAYYDNDYRLLTTKLNGTQNLSITYDNTMGNIVSRSDVAGGATWTYSATKKHAVTQAGSSSFVYAYDANGNMSSRQGQTIQWSSYNYPIAISAGSGSTAESISFSYGPDLPAKIASAISALVSLVIRRGRGPLSRSCRAPWAWYGRFWRNRASPRGVVPSRHRTPGVRRPSGLTQFRPPRQITFHQGAANTPSATQYVFSPP